jgi:hypothetical protein
MTAVLMQASLDGATADCGAASGGDPEDDITGQAVNQCNAQASTRGQLGEGGGARNPTPLHQRFCMGACLVVHLCVWWRCGGGGWLQCATAQDYNGCFCGCFRDKILGAGLSWGARCVSCVGVGVGVGVGCVVNSAPDWH